MFRCCCGRILLALACYKSLDSRCKHFSCVTEVAHVVLRNLSVTWCYTVTGSYSIFLHSTLYYEGKAMKTTFLKNYVYVLRTKKTLHMVSFIDFYFHFPANFQTLSSPHMFSIIYLCYVTCHTQ